MTRRIVVVLAAVAALALLGAFVVVSVPLGPAGTLPLDTITLPPGFAIDLYAGNVTGSRSMTLSPNGTLFVGSRGPGNVYAIPDLDSDGKGDK